MKQKIKNWLIHKLGGYTVAESVESDNNSWMIGRVVAINEIMEYAESLYGKDPESWCLLMWSYINTKIQENGQ